MSDQNTTSDPSTDEARVEDEDRPETEGDERSEAGAEPERTAGETNGEAGNAEEPTADEDGSKEDDRIAELESQLARKQADFENYKKRMDRRRAEERERATEDLATRLLSVRDDLDRALDQSEDADIRGGVESTLTEFDRVLADEGVEEIAPEPGSEVDPSRHEVMLRIDSEEPEDRIAEVFRPGYEMGGKVLRPAQITVSDGTKTEE